MTTPEAGKARPKRQKVAVFLLLAAAICLVFSPLGSSSGRGAAPLQISYINVGQGDSILLRDPDGFAVLIDGGEKTAGPTVVNYLKTHGVTTLNVMLATHPDSDHIGGLISVLQDSSITVQHVIYSGYPGTTLTWLDFKNAVAADGLTLEPVQFPATLHWGVLTVWVMNPSAGAASLSTNDQSLVLKVLYDARAFLFTGDISSTIEATLIARATPLAADVLKVAHHGSAYSSSPDFLASVEPKEAVISVGSNSYGMPSPDTLARLQAAGARIWRTDQNGNVIVNSDGRIYTISDVPIYNIYIPMVSSSFP